MAQTYLVQTWDKSGALKNHYEVTIASKGERAQLKRFLQKQSAHVVIAPVRRPPKRK